MDCVDIPDFRERVQRTPRIVKRLFTEAEACYAMRHNDPARVLAVRFAAKEATMKALGVGIGAFPLTDVEVVREPRSGAVFLSLTGQAKRLADLKGVSEWLLTVTHTAIVGAAVVVAL